MTDIHTRLENDYSFRPVSTEMVGLMDYIRSQYKSLAFEIVKQCPDNRSRAIALTELQQSKMWAVQSIVDGGK